jgi:hypothetical protein
MSQELQRITLDRVRRKEHIHWARIHAAALEVGVFTFAYDSNADGGQQYDYATGRAFSELVVHDALWEDDEVEWVAGVLVLRALIRTAMRGDARQRRLYEDLVVNYEERWKEMRDEARQALVTVRTVFIFLLLALTSRNRRRFLTPRQILQGWTHNLLALYTLYLTVTSLKSVRASI